MEVYVNTPEARAKFAALIRPLYKEIVDGKIVDMFVKTADKNR